MRALLFNCLFYITITIWCLCLLPLLLLPGRKPLMTGVRACCGFMLWLAKVTMGIQVEWRGFDTLPTDRAYIYLAKHMSYLDVFATFRKLPNMTALAKRELFLVPVLGLIFRKLNIVPIDRGKGTAKDTMPKVVNQIAASKRPLVVYPEATRIRPGQYRQLKSGAYFLQQDGQLDAYPLATNSGVHWGKSFWARKPGKVVLEVGEPIPHDLGKEAFMAAMAEKVVARSDALMRQLDGLDLPGPDAETKSNHQQQDLQA